MHFLNGIQYQRCFYLMMLLVVSHSSTMILYRLSKSWNESFYEES